jgi:hypothetical protein
MWLEPNMPKNGPASRPPVARFFQPAAFSPVVFSPSPVTPTFPETAAAGRVLEAPPAVVFQANHRSSSSSADFTETGNPQGSHSPPSERVIRGRGRSTAPTGQTNFFLLHVLSSANYCSLEAHGVPVRISVTQTVSGRQALCPREQRAARHVGRLHRHVSPDPIPRSHRFQTHSSSVAALIRIGFLLRFLSKSSVPFQRSEQLDIWAKSSQVTAIHFRSHSFVLHSSLRCIRESVNFVFQVPQ